MPDQKRIHWKPFVLDNLEQIITACQKGDLGAFTQLVHRTQAVAFSIAFRLLQNRQEAEDLVQQAFIRIWRHLDRFDGRVNFTTWLHQIVTRLGFDQLKTRQRRNRIISQPIEDNRSTDLYTETQPEQQLHHQEFQIVLEQSLTKLPPKQRVVFVLRDLQELSIQEVCQITGFSQGSVKTNLYLARKMLRQLLDSKDLR